MPELSNADCRGIATDNLIAAMDHEQWCSVVFFIKEGKIEFREVTCAFPTSDHKRVLEMLEEAFRSKRQALPITPLPLAPHLQNGSKEGICELCGEPMPPGEEMFKFHGFSGPCPVKKETIEVQGGSNEVAP